MNSESTLIAFFESKRQGAEYIEKFEENLSFFNSLLFTGIKEDIEFVISIKMYKYVVALNSTGNYSKALLVIDEIEHDLEKIKGESELYNIYAEAVTFNRGLALGKLKRYRKSNVEFKKLLKDHPANDNFIDWYKSNYKYRIGTIFNALTIVGISIYLIIMIVGFAGYRVKNQYIENFGLVIGLLSYVVLYICEKIIDMKKINFE